MNGRQAAKAAAKKIEELEWYRDLCIRDIKLYNECISGMIQHRSPCEWCNDLDECREAGKDVTLGCDEWMIKLWRPEEGRPKEAADEG
jgi:hypothetical protein